MAEILRDGTGKGNLAKVDDNNNLHTNSVSESFEAAESVRGNAYNMNTGDIVYDAASARGCSYIKNNENSPLVITGFIYLLGTSTGGSGDSLVQIIKNPTAGTLISSGTDGTPINRNFSSNKTLDVTWKIGDADSTVTDGTVAIESRFSSTGRSVVSVVTVLEKGAAMAIKYTPPSGNTSQSCQWAVAAHLDTLRGNGG